ncbi:Alpha carbonic anhydrase 4 [Linum perenne]
MVISKNGDIISLALLFLWFSISIPTICYSSESCDPSFTYLEGRGERGPSEWGSLNPDWIACGNGTQQSPIDLPPYRGVEVSPYLGKLLRDYKPALATVENKGYGIMVKWEGDAGNIKINGTRYNLEDCHWHTPSEHTFNGSRYEMELHVVHRSCNDDKTAVIGILYKRGRPDPFLSKFANTLQVVELLQLIHHINKLKRKGCVREVGIVNPGGIKFGSRKYYRYIGSLTTPPCTEEAVWTVVKKVRTVSRTQLKALQNAVNEGFENNARPIQASNEGRIQLYSPYAHRI